MGFDRWEDYLQALALNRSQVDEHFVALIANEESKDEGHDGGDDSLADWRALWLGLGLAHGSNAEELLTRAGFEPPESALARIEQLRESSQVLRMQAVARERLDAFIPRLLSALEQALQPTQALLRIIPLIESVLRRTAYFVLLVENPGALRQLVILCAASPWIAQQLARYPVLLDELLDARTLYQVPEKEALRADLQQRMLRINADDLEEQMEVLRYFKQAHQLHVSAAEVTGRLPLMKVSDYLTIIAEVILETVLDLAWCHLVAKHGQPQMAEGEPCDKRFIVIGYGKLGGIELGHGSDLDLVFIYDAPAGLATDGGRPIDNSLFFTRLGQRMIHILSTQNTHG